ncbi:hypothetical protein FALCPG4_015617 [Fusarium falciforme]
MHINTPFFSRGIPAECHEKMKAFANAGHRINWVAFPPGGGNSWSIVTNRTFFNRNIPEECHEKMRTFLDAGHAILCVAFPPGGGNSWSIVTNRTFFNRNIPEECHEKMRTFLNAGHAILCVAFPPGGGNSWSIITDRTFFNRNIPDECHEKMNALVAGGVSIRSVGFPKAGGNRWSIVGSTAFFNRNIPAECHRVMRAITGSGLGPLRAVAFHPDGGFVVFSRADALYADHPPLLVGRASFSLAKFAENIRIQLEGKGCKYALMVRYGPAIWAAADGPKRTATTPPAQDFTVFDRFNPASVTKVVTAVALLNVLEKRSLTINEPISNHLPSTWEIGPSVDTITVKELLSMTSGFRGGSKTYEQLRALVKNGINLGDKVPSYANCNYALARIVVAYLKGNDETVVDQAKETSKNFIDYVQQNAFDRLGIPGVEWKPEADAPTLFYPTPPGDSPGTAYGNWTLIAGSAGVHCSIAELSMFLNSLATTNVLLSAAMRSQMDTHGMGWGKLTDVNIGWYYRKVGYFPAAQNGGAELNTGVWKFSTGVQAVTMHNGSPQVDMPKAYNGAWTSQSLL